MKTVLQFASALFFAGAYIYSFKAYPFRSRNGMVFRAICLLLMAVAVALMLRS